MFSQHIWPLHNFHVDRSISLLFQIKAGVVVAATPNGRNSKHVYAYICVMVGVIKEACTSTYITSSVWQPLIKQILHFYYLPKYIL